MEQVSQAGSVHGAGGNGATWAGFLAAAFCAVGLMGLIASYVAPLPYQRAAHREAVLDQVLVVTPAGRAGLRDALGDSAAAVLDGTGALAPRVAAERVAMRARFAAEAAATAQRLRLLIGAVTVTGALFGAAVLAVQRGRGPQAPLTGA